MTLVRVTVAGTIGKAVRINTSATIGSQIGVDFRLPDGTIPTLAKLADALYIQSPPGEFVPDTGLVAGGHSHFESEIIDGLLLARVADDEVITGAYRFDDTLTMGNNVPINWLDSEGTPVELAILGVGVAGDPDISSVVLLADVENTDGEGDQAFVVTTGGHTLTATEASGGVAEVQGAQAKFGSFSMFADDGTGAKKARWGTTVNSTDFDFGSGDFTMECHLLFTRKSATDIPIFSKWKFNDFSFHWDFNSTTEKFQLVHSINGTSTAGGTAIAWPISVVTGVWYHMACSRQGNTIRFFVDGVLCSTQQDVTGVTYFTGDTEFEIFSQDSNGAGDHATFMDNARITKGVARYTATFTPPTAAFPITTGSIAAFTVGDPLVDMYLDANEIRIRGVTTDNYLVIDHDDTDINIVGVNTTDINFTGITAINQAGNLNVTGTLKVLDPGGTDSLAMAHDGTKFDFTFVNTSEVKFSGVNTYTFDRLISIVPSVSGQGFSVNDPVGNATMQYKVFEGKMTGAGAAMYRLFGMPLVRVDTDLDVTGALTAVSYSGILEANLLDKTTTETITGAEWRFNDNKKLKFGSSGDVAIDWDSSDFTIQGTSGTFIITGFNIAAGTIDADFDALTATSYGAILEANLLDKTATEDITGSYTFSIGPTFFSAGTEGAPGTAFVGDSDTGVFSPGANIYAITVGGTEAVRYTGSSAPLIRTGMNSGITASTTQTQGEQPLTASWNEVAVVANNNDVVTLPSMTTGEMCVVINTSAKKLQVFPASGKDCGAGVDTSVTIKANSSRYWFHYDNVVAFDIATDFAMLQGIEIGGATDNDLFYRSDGDWKHTAGKLTWDASLFDITGDLQVSGKLGFYGTAAISQPANITDAVTTHALNPTFSDAEVEAALDALGAKFNDLKDNVIEALGLSA